MIRLFALAVALGAPSFVQAELAVTTHGDAFSEICLQNPGDYEEMVADARAWGLSITAHSEAGASGPDLGPHIEAFTFLEQLGSGADRGPRLMVLKHADRAGAFGHLECVVSLHTPDPEEMLHSITQLFSRPEPFSDEAVEGSRVRSWATNAVAEASWVAVETRPVDAQNSYVALRFLSAVELTTSDISIRAFVENCFNPRLNSELAEYWLARPDVRVEFYDLNPFSSAAPSPVTGRAATPGTDRRCEVAFDGDAGAVAAEVAAKGLEAEGILREAPLPETHAGAALPGTTLLAARYLNPNRIAVVHTGTRPGPNGVETFLNVERLTPEASQ